MIQMDINNIIETLLLLILGVKDPNQTVFYKQVSNIKYKQHHRDPHPVNPRGKKSKPDSVLPSSLAKGYDSGPPSLHPWRI